MSATLFDFEFFANIIFRNYGHFLREKKNLFLFFIYFVFCCMQFKKVISYNQNIFFSVLRLYKSSNKIMWRNALNQLDGERYAGHL